MKHLLFEVEEQGKQYPCYVKVFREDDDITFTARSPQRETAQPGIMMAGNSGCCALNSIAIMKMIVALAEILPQAKNLKEVWE